MVTALHAVVLWTGGKDSALALYEAQRLGYQITTLVTFVPHTAHFHAHPFAVMQLQAQALGIPHQLVEVREPYFASYRAAIQALRENGVTTLVTGDISEVDGYPNWIRQCAEGLDMEVLTPLWHLDRAEVLAKLREFGFEVIFSCVKKPWFDESWAGRTIDTEAIRQMYEIRTHSGLDICGENGEYHTLVLDSPSFKERLQIVSCQKLAQDTMIYLDILETSLCPK